MKYSYFEGQGYLRPLNHLWALSMEWQFYLIFALSFRRFYRERHRLRWTFYLLTATALSLTLFFFLSSGERINTVYYSLAARFYTFGLGALSALAFVRRSPGIRRLYERSRTWTGFDPQDMPQTEQRWVPGRRGSVSELLGAVFLTVFIAVMFIPFSFEAAVRYGLPLSSLLITCLAIVVHEDRGRPAFFLRFKPFPWIASRSYEIYLWHLPIVTFLMYETGKTRLPMVLRYALCLILSLLIAEIAFRLRRGIGKLHAGNPQSRLFKTTVMTLAGIFIVLTISSLALFVVQPQNTELQQLQKRIEAREQQLAVGSARSADAAGNGEDEAGEMKRQDASSPSAPAAETGESLQDTGGDDTEKLPNEASEIPSENVSEAQPTGAALVSESGSEPVIAATNRETAPESSREDPQALMEAYLNDPPETEAYQYFKEWFPYGGDFLISQSDYMRIRNLPVTIIGDSLGVGLSYATDVFLPNSVVYAESNRWLYQGIDVIKELLQLNALNDPVVLVLGSNGDIEYDDLATIKHLIGERQLLLCTIILPDGETEARRNGVLRRFTEDYPDVKLVDWYDQAKGKIEMFTPDLIHTSIPGTRAYITLICSALADIYAGR